MPKDHKQTHLNINQNRSVANNSGQSGIALPAVTHSRMIKESDPMQGKFVIQPQKEEDETAQFVLQRLEKEEKSSSGEKMPFQLQINNSSGPVIQRALDVNFKSKENTISLSASGRPKWAAQVTKNLKPKEGESRGHIIEWSTRLRAYVNEINKLNKQQLLEKLGLGKSASDKEIQSFIYEDLRKIYNDLNNLSINDTGEDNDEGGLANTLAQQIDREKNKQTKAALLKQLFDHSFNPGKDNKGLAKFEEYKVIFAQAWNLPPEEVATWSNKWVKNPGKINEEKEPVREKEEINVLEIVRSIGDGIEELGVKKMLLEKAAAERIVSVEILESLKNEYVIAARKIAEKIKYLLEENHIKPNLATRMLDDLGKTLPTLS
ncbi:hypothetical protein [Chitinophaga oryziterrae]|nr:hypothetical protein [Chitinophaga oryziterrae]